jgi:hypothetical protein
MYFVFIGCGKNCDGCAILFNSSYFSRHKMKRKTLMRAASHFFAIKKPKVRPTQCGRKICRQSGCLLGVKPAVKANIGYLISCAKPDGFIAWPSKALRLRNVFWTMHSG